MLKPSKIERIPKELEKLMSEFEYHIMEDIVRRIRINKEITRSADWQIQRLVELGQSQEFVKAEIQRLLKLSSDEIDGLYLKAYESEYTSSKWLYEAVGKPQIPFGDNKELQQIIQAVVNQTKDDMVNITQSLGFTVDMGSKKVFTPMATYYQQILDDSMTQIITGTSSYDTVLKQTITNMSRSGIHTVDYASGWHNKITVASRRSIISGVGQITSKVNEMMANELDTDKFEVSYHATARESHAEWQGKVFTKEELTSICGLGTVTGLCGANCRHSYSPFIDGVSERTYTDEQLAEMNAKERETIKFDDEEYTSYEATQRMRELETRMRGLRQQTKLMESGGAEQGNIDTVKARYRIISNRYSKFAEAMKLPQERQRVYIDNLGRT